jgi:hypothetical protein
LRADIFGAFGAYFPVAIRTNDASPARIGARGWCTLAFGEHGRHSAHLVHANHCPGPLSERPLPARTSFSRRAGASRASAGASRASTGASRETGRKSSQPSKRFRNESVEDRLLFERRPYTHDWLTNR